MHSLVLPDVEDLHQPRIVDRGGGAGAGALRPGLRSVPRSDGQGRRAAGADAPLKIGLIGCGWYGGVVLKAAFETGGLEVVADGLRKKNIRFIEPF